MDEPKINFDALEDGCNVHRLLWQPPEFLRRYGLAIIGVGQGICNAADGFATCRVRRFEYYSVSHLYAGGGRIWLPGEEEHQIEPGSLVVIEPGALNRYGGDGSRQYIEDSIRFTGVVADLLRDSGIIKTGVLPVGTARLLLPVIELAQDPSYDAQLAANIALQKLLVELYLKRRYTAAPSPVDELLDTIKADPSRWWQIGEMAEFCSLSSDRLRRAFLKRTGMLPKHYIEALKLRRAAELLTLDDRPVGAVAAELGYVDRYHFSRRFKQFFGVAPEKYRREQPGHGRSESV